MLIALLIKFIYIIGMHMRQNYQNLEEKREQNGFENLKNSKAFIEYSNNIQDVHKKYEEFNQSRKCNVLIAFDDILADMISNKKLNLIVP